MRPHRSETVPPTHSAMRRPNTFRLTRTPTDSGRTPPALDHVEWEQEEKNSGLNRDQLRVSDAYEQDTGHAEDCSEGRPVGCLVRRPGGASGEWGPASDRDRRDDHARRLEQ